MGLPNVDAKSFEEMAEEMGVGTEAVAETEESTDVITGTEPETEE